MTAILIAALIALCPQPATEEDSPAWDCRTMGNHLCGPGNAQSVPAGDYSS